MHIKKYKFIIIFIVLSIIITGYIFSNSLKNGKESTKQSNIYVDIAIKIFDSHHTIPREKIEYIIRKAAHLTEFCILGISISCLVISFFQIFQKKSLFFGLFYCLLIAVIDEYIQSFTDRTSSVKDVIIDFSGALIGIFIVHLIWFIIQKKQKT